MTVQRRALARAKEKAPGAPTPDAYGRSRGLPQSFTRSQKERPLGERIVTAGASRLVAVSLRAEGNSQAGDDFYTGEPFGVRRSTCRRPDGAV